MRRDPRQEVAFALIPTRPGGAPCDMDPAEEVAKHNGKRSFRTYTLDRFQLLVCQQRRREVAEVHLGGRSQIPADQSVAACRAKASREHSVTRSPVQEVTYKPWLPCDSGRVSENRAKAVAWM